MPTILGKEVGPIGFGLLSLAMPWNPLSEDEIFGAIKAALNSGANYFDGGEFYGTPDRNSLTILNRYFEKYPEDADKIVLNIKGAVVPKERRPSGSKEVVSASIENCLKMLGPHGHIDQFEAARKDLNHDYEKETLRTIKSFVKSGKIGGIACSEINAATLRSAAKSFDITALEIELSLFHLDPLTNGLLEAAGELNIPILAYAPLGRGFLGGQIKSLDDIPVNDMKRNMPRFSPENFPKNLELVTKVEALAKKKGCTTSQIAINWLLSLSKRPGMPTIIPIPGSSKASRITENCTVIDLTEDDLAEIDRFLDGFVAAGERYPAALMKDLNL